ncbi:hypothetical protein HWV62_6701 [Athelia sp. TMB]|nr:hypothetical protein HWV62_6701 [Athelia sp. TMB]
MFVFWYLRHAASATAFVFLLVVALFAIAPQGQCRALQLCSSIFSVLTTTATSFLFLLRVRAVYSNSNSVTAAFGCLWFIMIAAAACQMKGEGTELIPNTQLCTQSSLHNYLLIIPSAVLCVTDTIFFLAISYRLAGNYASGEGWRAWARAFVHGDGLYSLSRSLLKSGQAYFLVVITFFFVNVIVMTVPGVPATMACILIPAYVGLTNIMACAVFRGMALGVYEDIPGTERIAFELGGWDEGVEARPGEFGLHDINLTDSACAIAQGGGC